LIRGPVHGSIRGLAMTACGLGRHPWMSSNPSFWRLLLLGSLLAAARPAMAQGSHVRSRVPVRAVRGVVYGQDLVRTAEQYLGVPYRWGGTSPAAFDCSGFVQYVFAQYGIAFPRTAHEQAAVGDAPLPGDLRPGDLLFFYGGRGAQHVAIYVGGDTIIHASSSGRRVKFDRLSGPHGRRTWFGRRLIAIRRVLPADGVFMMPLVAAPDSASGLAGGGEPSDSAVALRSRP
jgi:hypothetical protein